MAGLSAAGWTYAMTGVNHYLESLTPPKSIAHAFGAIAAHKQTLIKPLLSFLTEKEQRDRGVPKISFVVVGQSALKSKDIVRAFDETQKVGIRWGHFYAYTLVQNLAPKVER